MNNLSNTYYTPITVDGNNIVEYSFIDNANNSVTGITYALLDKIAPVTDYSGCDSGWNNESKIIIFSCTDATSGCAHNYSKIDSGSWVDSNTLIVNTDGNHLIEYYSMDTATNSEIQKSFYCAIDAETPTIDLIINNDVYNSYDYDSQDFNVIFNQVSFGSSGIKDALYRLNSGSWISLFTDDNIDFYVPITIDGNNQLDYNFVDNANNSLSETTYALLDTVAPVTNYSGCGTGWNNEDKTITFYCTDATSGCSNNYNRLDSDSWVDSNTLLIDTDGNHLVEYYSIDNTANIESEKSFYCAIDTNAAVIDLSATISIYRATINLTSNEDVSCRISDNNIDFDSMDASTEKTGTSMSWIYDSLANNDYNYYVVCKDIANNLTSEVINFRINYGSHGGNSTITSHDESLETNEAGLTPPEVLIFTRSEETSDGLIITRIVKIIVSEKNEVFNISARYSVLLHNPSRGIIKGIFVTEYIPKEIAKDISDIIFDITPDRIISADPIVQWYVLEIQPGQTIDFNYSINTIADDDILKDANNFFEEIKMIDANINKNPVDNLDENLVIPSIDENKDVAIVDNIKKYVDSDSYNKHKLPILWIILILLLIYLAIVIIHHKQKGRKQKLHF